MNKAIDEWRWEIRSPAAEERGWGGSSALTAPAWIDGNPAACAVGEVLYDEGRRPQFRHDDGTFADCDPLDLLAYHVLGRYAGELVGCIRFVGLADPVKSMTEQVLGRERFERMLTQLDSPREATADVGRWVVHPEFRRHRVALSLVAGCWSYLQELGFQTAIATVGTRAGQNAILRRTGLAPVPGVPPHLSRSFDDELCTMFATLNDPAPNFRGMVEQMGRRLVVMPNEPVVTPMRESA